MINLERVFSKCQELFETFMSSPLEYQALSVVGFLVALSIVGFLSKTVWRITKLPRWLTSLSLKGVAFGIYPKRRFKNKIQTHKVATQPWDLATAQGVINTVNYYGDKRHRDQLEEQPLEKLDLLKNAMINARMLTHDSGSYYYLSRPNYLSDQEWKKFSKNAVRIRRRHHQLESESKLSQPLINN